jgi:hypothetical protein
MEDLAPQELVRGLTDRCARGAPGVCPRKGILLYAFYFRSLPLTVIVSLESRVLVEHFIERFVAANARSL